MKSVAYIAAVLLAPILLLGCPMDGTDGGPFPDAEPSSCGNEVIDAGEECDAPSLGGASCTALGFTAGALDCTPDCMLDTSACTVCGNDLVDGAEECDSQDLGGLDCQDLGLDGGELACAQSCSYDLSGCSTCGNGLVEGDEECDDGNLEELDVCTSDCTLVCFPSFWSKHAANPVMDLGAPGTWEGYGVLPGTVLDEGGTLRMWYSGFDGLTWRIGHATSPDGLSWSRDGWVLDVAPPPELDDIHVRDPSVLIDGAGYRMLYSGHDGTLWQVFSASSPDGINWTRNGPDQDVNSSCGSGCANGVMQPHTMREKEDEAQYYTGSDGTFLWIMNMDWGASLEPSSMLPASPMFWDGEAVSHPWVIPFPTGGYRMWYVGNDGLNDRIGVGTSSNGTLFSHDAIVIDLGGLADWDSTHVSSPTVLTTPDVWHMWFGGFDGTAWRIGYATATCGS